MVGWNKREEEHRISIPRRESDVNLKKLVALWPIWSALFSGIIWGAYLTFASAEHDKRLFKLEEVISAVGEMKDDLHFLAREGRRRQRREDGQ